MYWQKANHTKVQKYTMCKAVQNVKLCKMPKYVKFKRMQSAKSCQIMLLGFQVLDDIPCIYQGAVVLSKLVKDQFELVKSLGRF